jgi:hypothetical protein
METKWQVIGMHKTDFSSREIGRRLGISEKCVRTTLGNSKRFGSVTDKPCPGARKKISDRDENALYRYSRQDPNKSVTALTAELNETLIE